MAVAQAVPPGATVIDVGTDHARLPVWLIQSGTACHVLATDLRSGPLQSAKMLIEQTATEDFITIRQTDGLDGITPQDGDVITIAGMGGETMVSILSAAPWTAQPGKLLILEPQSTQTHLRQFLNTHGYVITGEQLVKDAGRIYPVLTVQGGEAPDYTDAELLVGKYEQVGSDALFGEYTDLLLKRLEKAAQHDDNAATLMQDILDMKAR